MNTCRLDRVDLSCAHTEPTGDLCECVQSREMITFLDKERLKLFVNRSVDAA